MARRKLTKAEQIARTPIESFMTLKGKEGRKALENVAKTLMAGYKRRVGSFKRKNLVSYAQISLEASIPPNRKQIKDMSRNQLILEIARYQKFFNDQTSSEAGIRSVNREQDVRIFGADKRGRPNRTMTSQERLRYWSMYDEYLNINPTETYKYGSESVQQALADIMFTQGTTGEDFMSIMDRVQQKLQEEALKRNARERPNVYSGRGPTF